MHAKSKFYHKNSMENAGDANLRALWPLVLANQESINTILPHKRGSLEQIKHILQSDELNNIESEELPEYCNNGRNILNAEPSAARQA
jgi:hypothetical protein